MRYAQVMRLVALLVVLVSTAHADPVHLRVGTMAVDGSRYMLDIVALGKEIEQRTKRSVRIDWVSGGQLGDDRAMADQIAEGKLDGGGLSETGLVALVPDMRVWQYPGLFRDDDEVDRATAALDTTVRERFAARGIQFAMWADLGFSHLFSTEPIASLRDVLRAAAPWLTAPIDGKLTAAITGGRARAWALPPLYMLVIGATKAHYMTSLRYRYVIGGLVFSKAAWARLDAAQQTAVLDVCRAWEPKIRASWRHETEQGIAALDKAGVKIRRSPDAELAAFTEASTRSRRADAKGGVAELAAKIVAALAR